MIHYWTVIYSAGPREKLKAVGCCVWLFLLSLSDVSVINTW